ncbi:uncharacterized protein [Periplaneta americana]|uniref:uncharacterized protein isoform X2 n=1 Tax=Periplaneta americana TaxID=6978 RepID=UPI0037E78F95
MDGIAPLPHRHNNTDEAGFRDGAAAGRDAVFQKGFDKGYSEGYRAALSLGYLKGALSIMHHHTEESDPAIKPLLNTNLQRTSRGMCQLCAVQKNSNVRTEENEFSKADLCDIINQQATCVQQEIDRIRKDTSQLSDWNVVMMGRNEKT